ncbi:FAR-17a/AIG1-like protein-domain-containing protein [Dissophora ornata]|nr:FAR-17a/AIG1-like protein-domain-containing protein [Dissophora ornata]
MVLQLSTSPFAARATSSKLSGSSSASPASPSSTASSASSPFARFSFFSNRAAGHQYTLNKRSTKVHQRFSSSTAATTAINAMAKKGDRQYKIEQQSKDMWARTLFRLVGLLSGVSTLLIVPFFRAPGYSNGFGRGTQFLTIVSLILTMLCLGLGIVGDLLKQRDLIRLKNAILPVVVPAECVVTILYWYLTLSDVYNIYPDGNRYLPVWLDIQMHGLPFVYVFVEMFCYSETFQVRRVNDFFAVAAFTVLYMVWASFCAYMDGYWPYPIFDNLNCPWKQLRLMLISGAISLALQVIISETHIRTRAASKVRRALDSASMSS